VVLLFEDKALCKISKLELLEIFADFSKLKISEKKPLAASGGDS
jgi:hypothetical protein